MQHANFINIDVELKSREDLSPLLSTWDDDIAILYQNYNEGMYFVSFEVVAFDEWLKDEFASEQLIIDEMARLVSQLTEPVKEIWQRCVARQLDFGYQLNIDFETGKALHNTSEVVETEKGSIIVHHGLSPYCFSIPSEALSALSALGVSLTFTLYPCSDP